MQNKPNNHSAFSCDETTMDNSITMRDYFAAAAMTGLIAKGCGGAVHLSKIAYEYADGMLSERAEPKQTPSTEA